jgi:hypothetical protein
MERVMERIPAKTIADIEVPDGAYKPDFELTDRFQGFAAELLRLALLGIAGYGFLISDVLMKLRENSSPSVGSALLSRKDLAWLLGVGIVALGSAAGCALVYRLWSTSCLGHQLSIVRTLKRMEQANWSSDERVMNEIRLKEDRAAQREILSTCHWFLKIAATSLGIGAIAVVLAFVLILKRSV